MASEGHRYLVARTALSFVRSRFLVHRIREPLAGLRSGRKPWLPFGNFVAHLGAWGLEQVEHGLGAANKRLFDSRAHDGGSDNSSAKRSRGNRHTAQKSRMRQSR